jgi:hypothetical protein
MPCGGGSIGLNVWVEHSEILFYIARSGSFDENNALLKSGRIRLKLSPNPLGSDFKQELDLKTGTVTISGKDKNLSTQILFWVDVLNPVIHVEINSSKPIIAEAIYENWRWQNRVSAGKENNANSYKWASQYKVTTFNDEIDFDGNGILFYHRNRNDKSIFDVTVKQQGLDSVKDQLFNPLQNLIFGGRMESAEMKPGGTFPGKYIDTDFKGWRLVSKQPSTNHELHIYLHTDQASSLIKWKEGLGKTIADYSVNKNNLAATRNWWKQFWERSFIFIEPENKNASSVAWQTGRNYQLFRYMLACNAFGGYPTKFNGGLFTYDPSLVDPLLTFTPDFRNWGGGVHTAQNQRLVYWPMIKSGDFEIMKSQFDFYLRILKNAELRSNIYWGHNGACFTEQMENFGLPNLAEYGLKRPANFDPGVEYNAWLEYLWDTSLEFCLMILETERYNGTDISKYIPLIESCLAFFDQHYQWLAKQRGIRYLDATGHLILYPGSACETYKMAYNSTSTIAALKTVTEYLLQLPGNYLTAEKRKSLDSFLHRIPPISFAAFDGHETIAPAKSWERVNNIESPQLYPIFPWGIFGVGKPHLDIALNTWNYDSNVVKFKSHVGWKQDNIFAARLGLTDEAAKLTSLKLQNSERRFPAFWGPGFDWAPDHNWGGSGMIGLQEMLLQVDGEKIFLFPAWPKEWNVHFKLNAPYQTTVEAILRNGKIDYLKVLPASREKNIINLFDQK